MKPAEKAPSTYMGVPVPDTLINNWDTAEAYWWRTGTLAGLAADRPELSAHTIAELRHRAAQLRLRAANLEESRLALAVPAARLRRGEQIKTTTSRAAEYEALADLGEAKP